MKYLIFSIVLAVALAIAAQSQAGNGRYCTATGAAAISASCRPFDNAVIERVTLKLSAAASTSENVVVTLDSGNGAAYDLILLTFNPSAIGGTSFIWVPDEVLSISMDDVITVTFTNTDTLTYGVTIRYSL
jgi:hypothetical protein